MVGACYSLEHLLPSSISLFWRPDVTFYEYSFPSSLNYDCQILRTFGFCSANLITIFQRRWKDAGHCSMKFVVSRITTEIILNSGGKNFGALISKMAIHWRCYYLAVLDEVF